MKNSSENIKMQESNENEKQTRTILQLALFSDFHFLISIHF